MTTSLSNQPEEAEPNAGSRASKAPRATHAVSAAESFLVACARDCAFDEVGATDALRLTPRTEVRDMCAANLCRAYNASWSCPPACPSIDEYASAIAQRTRCIVVQTVGQLEDPYDFESMQEAERIHKARFLKLVKQAREQGIDGIYLASGSCTLCTPCTYPNEPCRHPDERLVSMEAAGLVVTEVCESSGIPYNHGPNTIAYSSCIVL